MDMTYRFPYSSSRLQIIGCHIGSKPAEWVYEEHHHHLYELFCCISGQVCFTVNPAVITLHPGDWLLLRSGAKHSLHNKSTQPLTLFNFHFDIDDHDIRKMLSSRPYRHFPDAWTSTSPLPGRIRELEQLMQRPVQAQSALKDEGEQLIHLEFEDHLLFQGTSLFIIHDILRLLAHQTPGTAETLGTLDTLGTPETLGTPRPPEGSGLQAASFSAADDGYVSPLTTDLANAIEAKLAEQQYTEPSIAEAAKSLNLSLSQCAKIFQRVYGTSPRNYVSRLKLSKAKELLTTTNRSIGDIAEQLGFQSASHFSRQFRRWSGVSPLQFRGAATAKAAQTTK